ncbi:hypothetical protein ABPG74_019744 [Tetrahymena malaccensis]
MSLKCNLIEYTIPAIKNHQNYDFIQNVLSQMIHFQQKYRLEPLQLIQNLKSYKIEQNCLKQLQFPQQLKNSIPYLQQNVVQHSKSQYMIKKIDQIPQYFQKSAQDQLSYQQNTKYDQQVTQKQQIDEQLYQKLKHLIDKKDINLSYYERSFTKEQIEAIFEILNGCYQLEGEIQLQFSKCQITDEQCLSLFSFLKQKRNQKLKNIFIDLSGNHKISSYSLFPLFDTLNNQQNLFDLRLHLYDMRLNEDTLIYLSKILPQFTYLKQFNLGFGNNYSDYDSIKGMIKVLAKNNTYLEILWFGFSEMKSIVFQDFDMILSIFNYFDSMKRLSEVTFWILDSYNNKLIKESQLYSLNYQKASYQKHLYY